MEKNTKTTPISSKTKLLPLQGYMSSLVSRAERTKLKMLLMEAMGISSDVSFYRFVVARTHRPDYAKREAAAEVIRNHSGNNAYTGEDLFPEALYRAN